MRRGIVARLGCALISLGGLSTACGGGSDTGTNPGGASSVDGAMPAQVSGSDASSGAANLLDGATAAPVFDASSSTPDDSQGGSGSPPDGSGGSPGDMGTQPDGSGSGSLDGSFEDVGTETRTDGSSGATGYNAIYSGVPLVDTSGNLVNAHGVGFLHLGDTYYMIGEQRSGKNDTYSGASINAEDSFTGVSLYSTKDFANWTFVGTIVKPIAGTDVAPPYYGERPKILHNASTNKYVVYIKMLNYTSSYVGYYAVLTSDSIAGPYSYHGNLNVSTAEDFEVFQDTDGSQYLLVAGGKIYKLSADGLSVGGAAASGVQSGEGVSLFKAGNTYFYQSSKGTYWHSNDNSYSSASSLGGPWTGHGNFCPTGAYTWQSQDTAVVPVVGSSGTTYIYVGDRWVNGDLPASTLVVQPLTISGNTESIPQYQPVWSLNVASGTSSAVTVSGTSINDNTVGSGPNTFAYSGSWTHATVANCFDGDVHSSAAADATATMAFTGTQVVLYSAYDNSSGIMGVSILNGSGAPVVSELPVSLRYDVPAAGNYMVYASPVLPSGAYTLKVRVTGKKDLYSGGASCNIDRVVVVP